MKNFFKLYWPMIISILFLFIYGIMIGTIFYSEAIFDNDFIGLLTVVVTLLLVVAIFAEMIYCMIKACNNKELKNKGVWCVCLYFFHIFIIPYFYLKHICSVKQVKNKMIIFVVLSIISLGLGIFVTFKADTVYSKEPLYIVEDGVKVKFSGGFRETEIGEYDFYAKDSKRQINFGGFIYDEDDSDTPTTILKSRDNWIKTSRGSVTYLDTITEETDDSIINTNIYIGTNNGIKNMYYISTIEFKDTNCFVNVISTYLHDDYLDYKDELLNIFDEMEYVGEEL